MPKFEQTYCSHCGGSFGPGDHGYSHCEDHRPEGWPPFRPDDVVRIRGNDHLGLHRVESCEWFTGTRRGVPAYWLCECEQIREPIDWVKLAPGAIGIVTSSSWRGSADNLTIAIMPNKCANPGDGQ